MTKSRYRQTGWWILTGIEIIAVGVLWAIADPDGWKWLAFMAAAVILSVTNYCEGVIYGE